MKAAMERHERGDAIVIPILLSPVDWSDAPFSRLQVLPTQAKPITKWRHRDDALADVARGIRDAIERMAARRSA